MPRPESGFDCLVCAIFARQRQQNHVPRCHRLVTRVGLRTRPPGIYLSLGDICPEQFPGSYVRPSEGAYWPGKGYIYWPLNGYIYWPLNGYMYWPLEG